MKTNECLSFYFTEDALIKTHYSYTHITHTHTMRCICSAWFAYHQKMYYDFYICHFSVLCSFCYVFTLVLLNNLIHTPKTTAPCVYLSFNLFLLFFLFYFILLCPSLPSDTCLTFWTVWYLSLLPPVP